MSTLRACILGFVALLLALCAFSLTGCHGDYGTVGLRNGQVEYIGPPGSAWFAETSIVRNDDLDTTPTRENAPDARIVVTIPLDR